MRFNKLDLNLLVALDVLLKERSVTRAAAELNLSMSAMSSSLSRLREYFDDDLLVQIGRKMEITPRGEVLHDAVRNVLLTIDSTIAAESVFEPQRSDRTFKILASDYTQVVLAPALMGLAAETQCTARFNFVVQNSTPSKDLERGEADLLIIPTGFMSPDHPHEALYQEDFVCMVWRHSKLAQGELDFERYANAEHAVTQPASSARTDAFEGWFLKRYGLTRRVAVSTYSFVTLPVMLIGTEMVATVHARVAARLAKAWPLEIRPTPMPFDRMEQSVQWHKFRTTDPGLVWLRGMLAEAVRRMDDGE
jgi:LysR family transcriptional regulator, nod-box dependent transcriptional activator